MAPKNRFSLELSRGTCGALVEEAVDGAGIEAQVVEHALELHDVGAPERWLAHVDQASPRTVAGFVDLVPGNLTDEAVGEYPYVLLKRLYGELGPGPKDPVYPPVAELEPQVEQAGLEVHHPPSPVAFAQRAHGLKSPRWQFAGIETRRRRKQRKLRAVA
jgi:hypothetical protein